MEVDGTDYTTLPVGIWPMWSPDGTQIASEYNHEIVILDLDGTIVRSIALPSSFDSFQMRWSPDGTQFAAITGGDSCKGSGLNVIQLDGALIYNGVYGCARDLEWSPQ